MSIAGLAVEYLFKAVGIPDPGRPTMIVHTGFQWNYTSVLNILALAGITVIYWLYRHRDTSSGRFAKDPICGMQVEIEHAPARRVTDGQTSYFCSDHCAHRYDADPQPAADGGDHNERDHEGVGSKVDPVCEMTVDPATAQHTIEHGGATIYFCGPACCTAFQADPDAYPLAWTKTKPGVGR